MKETPKDQNTSTDVHHMTSDVLVETITYVIGTWVERRASYAIHEWKQKLLPSLLRSCHAETLLYA